MKKSTSDLVAEIKQVHRQYLAEVGSGGHKVWPRSIKERIFELVDSVGSIKSAAELSGVSVQTIYQWRSDIKKNRFKALTVTGPSIKTPTVTVAKSDSESRSQSLTVTVTTPQNYKVDGLSLNQAVELLLKLGAR